MKILVTGQAGKSKYFLHLRQFGLGTCGFCGEPRTAEKQLHVYSSSFFVKGHRCVLTLDLPVPHLDFFSDYGFHPSPPEYLKHVDKMLM